MASVSVLWTSAELGSAEHLVIDARADGTMLMGTTVVAFDDRPAHIQFSVNVDTEWRTRAVEVDVVGHGSTTIQMRVDGDGWVVDGVARADLAECVDVDLGWTPATNTLPIRRLGIGVGESARITTAWLKFPEMVVVPSEQRYVREAESTWRYLSGAYNFVLETNNDGIVTKYGDDLWVARAVSTT